MEFLGAVALYFLFKLLQKMWEGKVWNGQENATCRFRNIASNCIRFKYEQNGENKS